MLSKEVYLWFRDINNLKIQMDAPWLSTEQGSHSKMETILNWKCICYATLLNTVTQERSGQADAPPVPAAHCCSHGKCRTHLSVAQEKITDQTLRYYLHWTHTALRSISLSLWKNRKHILSTAAKRSYTSQTNKETNVEHEEKYTGQTSCIAKELHIFWQNLYFIVAKAKYTDFVPMNVVSTVPPVLMGHRLSEVWLYSNFDSSFSSSYYSEQRKVNRKQ